MAHFAQLDPTNTVLRVIVIGNDAITDPETGEENESLGVPLCQSHFGDDTVCKQTSYNQYFRIRFAGIGFTYDEDRDAFIPPKPHPSWILNDETTIWEPPGGWPENLGEVPGPWYQWDESGQEWILLGHD